MARFRHQRLLRTAQLVRVRRNRPMRSARVRNHERPRRGSEYTRRLIAASGLPRAEKAVLNALALHADWETGGGITATVPTIAAEAGYSRNWAGKKIKALVKLGVVKVIVSSRGGRSAGCYGRTHELCIVCERLQELAAQHDHEQRSATPDDHEEGVEASSGDAASLNCKPGVYQLHTQRPSTANSLSINCKVDGHNQYLEQGTPTPPPSYRKSQTSRGGCETSESCSVEAAAAAQVLVDFGVSESNAKALAATHGLAQVRLAVLMAKRAPGNIQSRPGFAVSLIRDGSVERELQKRQRARRSSSESATERWRISQIFLLRTTLGSMHGKANWPNGVGVLKDVRATWPTDEAIVQAAVLSERDYHEVERRPMEIASKLREAAARHNAATNSPAERRTNPSAATISGVSS